MRLRVEVEEVSQAIHRKFYTLHDFLIFGMQFGRKVLASK
jgi:hypothetical protein